MFNDIKEAAVLYIYLSYYITVRITNEQIRPANPASVASKYIEEWTFLIFKHFLLRLRVTMAIKLTWRMHIYTHIPYPSWIRT